jgi:hypothetical protein
MTSSGSKLTGLQERYRHVARQLAGVGFIRKGSLAQRCVRCGTASCSCHDDPPRLRGPCWQWSTKGKGVTRIVTADEAPIYREFMENRDKVEELPRRMYEIPQKALDLRTSGGTRNDRRPPHSTSGIHRRAATTGSASYAVLSGYWLAGE